MSPEEANTAANLDALVEWHEQDASGGDDEFFRHDGYVLTVDDLRRSAAAVRSVATGDALAAAAAALMGHRCTTAPADLLVDLDRAVRAWTEGRR